MTRQFNIAESYSLARRKVLVTGGYGYLGAAMVRALAGAGAHVLINGRSGRKCQAFADELTEAGFAASAAPFDVSDTKGVSQFFAELDGSALHGLINNAYAGAAGTIETLDEAAYGAAYDVTVTAAHRLLRTSLPNLRRAVTETGAASVLNMASMYGLVSPVPGNYERPEVANPASYGAAKAGLVQFTRYAACEFGPYGIRVNALAPGPFPSHTTQEASPEFVERLARNVPMQRVGLADELGGPTVFLLSQASSFVNGAVLCVDGGWTSW
ncbi:SDR family NAD(P)-dependent oxidoreductase [Qipengyuania huizhouensis]|uniref:SDR family NAD(P)-dependent oxidoreductase n=1 Tax=Qipengyuania huizhouensis TaxID=2867245 RepID=UPI001C88C1D2|nr:SDR family oxidoreductase [Qipengyuania huizhouensis]MBX7460379.1 SDR family oxidoreductase [Qipengyuania huizhouensis]